MGTALVVIHVITCVLLVLVVLVQSGKDGGLGMMSGGGSSQTVFGNTGGANFFTKFTSITAAVFMVTSIGLTIAKSGSKKSVFDRIVNAPAAKTAPAATQASPQPPKDEASSAKH